MGRVYAWKLRKWDNGRWVFGYSWLTRDPDDGFSESTPSDSALTEARDYATELFAREDYEGAFSRMLANIPSEYKCATNFGGWEDYYYNACEWGGQNEHCGVIPNPKIVISVDKTTITGDGIFYVTAKVTSLPITSVTLYVGSSSVRPESQSGNIIKYQLVNLPVGSYSLIAKSGNVESNVLNIRVLEDTYGLSFNPSTKWVSSGDTSSTSELVIIGTVTDIEKESCTGGCNDVTVSGNNWTISFDPNTSEETKEYVLTVKGYGGTSRTLTRATFTVEQEGSPVECEPGIEWKADSKGKEVPSSSTSFTLYYTIPYGNCCPDGIVVESSDSSFTPGIASGGSVTIMYDANQDQTPKTTTLTIKCKKTGYADAIDETSFTQKGKDVDGGIEIISGSTLAPASGASQSYTARADYVVWDGAVSSDDSVTITNIQNSGSTSTGASDVNVTFTVNFPSISVTGTTEISVGGCDTTITVTTPGYDSGTYSGNTLTVCPPSKTVTITVYGKDKNGARKSDSITINQE